MPYLILWEVGVRIDAARELVKGCVRLREKIRLFNGMFQLFPAQTAAYFNLQRGFGPVTLTRYPSQRSEGGADMLQVCATGSGDCQ